MIRTVCAFAALAVATPGFAQSPPPATAASPQADPAKLDAATRIAGKLLPDGTYRKMMSGMLDKMMGGVIEQVTDLPIRSLAEMGGLAPDKVKALGPGTLKQLMAILDPAFDERIKTTTNVMMTDMVDIMSKMEPSVREGLAEAYANRFTAAQLADLERFFGTPTGGLYAEQSMQIYTDPAIITRMQAMVPQIMQAMPAMMQKVTSATAGLPRPKKAGELTSADKAKLAELLGIDPKKMK